MTVASKYVSLRVKDSDGVIILDERIDPEGSISPLSWTTRSFALVEPHARSIAAIEFYVDMSASAMNIPWDQRLTIWLDNLAIEPRVSRADFDFDFDVDQSDFGHFQACMSGPGVEQSASACLDTRLDEDVDVDRDDFALFAGCLSGAETPADPDCLP